MRVYVDSTIYEIFSFTFRIKYKHTVNYKSATETFETLHVYLWTSGHNRILEKTGGQVSKANIFETPDLSSCEKVKSCFKFGPNYLTNRARLKFYFCGKWKLHSLTSALVGLYSLITPHKSISSIWSSSYSASYVSHSAVRGVGVPSDIYDIYLLKVNICALLILLHDQTQNYSFMFLVWKDVHFQNFL
jgi:hypothetical protein